VAELKTGVGCRVHYPMGETKHKNRGSSIRTLRTVICICQSNGVVDVVALIVPLVVALVVTM
jgi:hypothetical protein